MTPTQTKFAIVITAAICLPLGALTQRQASAQKRLDDLDPVAMPQTTSHFGAAQLAMHTAWNEINASQRADEDVWRDDAGHGAKARDLIEHALRVTDQAASWAHVDAPAFIQIEVPHRRLLVRQHATP